MRFAVASRMRTFAWCGISQSMSSSFMPAAATTSRAASSSTLTATLNTSLALHLQERRADDAAAADVARHRKDARLAAVRVQHRRMHAGLAAPAASTTAPAPSPNSTQVAAVVPVEDAREHFGAHDQGALVPFRFLIMLSAVASA